MAPDRSQFLRGVELFNAGYYWEAHEAWEGSGMQSDATGPPADLIKGLIKLAAAGVKVREGQAHGVRTHAGRAAEFFAAARDRAGSASSAWTSTSGSSGPARSPKIRRPIPARRCACHARLRFPDRAVR